MCTENRAVGVTQDGGDDISYTASTASHELGHIFNMQHDDNPPSTYVCKTCFVGKHGIYLKKHITVPGFQLHSAVIQLSKPPILILYSMWYNHIYMMACVQCT